MYARMVTAGIKPERVNEAVQRWRETVAPSVQQREGFISARLLIRRDAGKIVSIGLWETEADFQATIEWNREQVATFTDFFTEPPVVDGYEVVAEVVVKDEK